MTKLKSALLGTAAAMMAVTGAQAADLTPEPTYDYVRICDQYGAKYYYIPQTDTCIKIGGNVQWRATVTIDRDITSRGYFAGGTAVEENPTEFEMLGRARLNFDVREETEYGTLRAFVEWEASGSSLGTARFAYIQFAGFTMGQAGIPFGLGIGGGPNYLTIAGDDGTSRGEMIYYSAEFGNGFGVDVGIYESATFDANQSVDGAILGDTANGGDDLPDGIARIRVEQGWGSASVSGLIRDVESFTAPSTTDSEVGWAVRGTLKANLNMLGNGGSIGILGTYTNGASNFAADHAFDGYIDATGDLELIETWNVRATAEVGVSPNLNIGIWGGYATVIDVEDFIPVGAAQTETWWNIGATATWTPVSNLSIGLDVVYENEEIVTNTAGVFSDDTNDYWKVAVGATRSF